MQGQYKLDLKWPVKNQRKAGAMNLGLFLSNQYKSYNNCSGVFHHPHQHSIGANFLYEAFGLPGL